MQEFKWIWQYLRRYKLRMFTGFILVAIVTVLSLVNPFLNGLIVDRVIYKKETNILLIIVGIMLVSTLLKSSLRYIFQMIFEYISQSVIYEIREKIYVRIQELDFDFFDRTKTGDVMSRMTGDLEAVRHFTAGVIWVTYNNLLTFIAVVVILFTIDVKFTLMMLAISPLIAFVTFKLAKIVKPAFSAIREQFAKLNSVVQENISGNRVVKAFAKEDHEINKFSEENRQFKEKNLEAARVWEKYLPMLDCLAGTLSIVVILAGGAMVIKGSLTLGELVAFNGYIWALNMPMRMSGWLVNDIQRFAASAEKIKGLMEREATITNSDNCVNKGRLKGAIEFKNVGFCYCEEKVLHDISFKANPGQTIAIVGPTGGGKSTIISLISRFYDCCDGSIKIDGIDVKDIELGCLRRNVGVAMQDIFLFSDTIEGNISYGVPDASMDMVKWAAKLAGAHGFIKGFTEGYDTIIGERGVGLSGGQRQRIALARAILKNAPIVILDDTTSSVDIETEHEIQKALKSFYADKTTFVIAHRISSVKNADLILVVENGRIIERGCHQELIDKKGYYYEIYQNQYGDFDVDFEMQGA